MRNAILATTMALTLATGQVGAAPQKALPTDVGTGRIAWFDITTTNLPQSKEFYGGLFDWAIDLVVDPSGHPIGLYSRTLLPPKPTPTK